jgi:hypothetical protein
MEAAAPTFKAASPPASSEALRNLQRYPVDDITMRYMCELLTQVRNKHIAVAYGVVEVPTQGERLMNMEIEWSMVGMTSNWSYRGGSQKNLFPTKGSFNI